MSFKEIYFISLAIGTTLSLIRLKMLIHGVSLKERKIIIWITIFAVLIPIINSIWAFALICSLFEKRAESKKRFGNRNAKHYLMIHHDRKAMFIYNEEQKYNNDMSGDHAYNCLYQHEDVNEVIREGREKAEIDKTRRFNSKYSNN